jgi:lipopolysaccharide heptosyltransferase III
MIKPDNLLIVRTDRIGDVVLTLPLAGIIKKRFPFCKITFLIREYTNSIVKDHPFIDDVLILQEKEGKPLIRKNILAITDRKFDSAVIVYPTFTLSLIVYLSGIKNIVGTGFRWYSFFFKHKVFQHRKYAEMHELEFNLKLLQVFDITEEINKEKVNFNLKVKDNQKVNELVNRILLKNKRKVVIHPGSGGSAVDLPIEKFRELVVMLDNRNDIGIIITGSVSETNLGESLKVSERVYNMVGKFDLSELISLINKCDIFISNSTGPIHIAAALGRNTIGFYPNLLQCSAKRWGPYSDKSVIFTPQNECNECKKEQCRKVECINGIDMQKVYSVILGKLNLS